MTQDNDNGNVAVVTGGSAGIGAAICRAMLDRGYEVVSLDRRPPAWTHANLRPVEVDLLDGRSTHDAAVEIAARHAITHIVHNAGVIRPNLVGETPLDDVQALTQLHLGAALVLLKAVLPAMKERAFGRIILMSSRAALGAVGRTAYSATKAGIIGLGRTWALELAPSGITVNVVAPGPIQGTEMFHGIVPKGSEREASLADAIPVKRLGRVEDVANAVMFFADRRSSFVTGQVLYVCGGSSVGTLVV